MTYIHINRPRTTYSCMVNACPTCERQRRMLGAYQDWYGITWTCAGCGDQWQDGERLERQFSPSWRQRNILYARERLAAIGVQA